MNKNDTKARKRRKKKHKTIYLSTCGVMSASSRTETLQRGSKKEDSGLYQTSKQGEMQRSTLDARPSDENDTIPNEQTQKIGRRYGFVCIAVPLIASTVFNFVYFNAYIYSW